MSARRRERWSAVGRRAMAGDVGERMASWLLDVVATVGGELEWETVSDVSQQRDDLVHRRLTLEGRRKGTLLARASSELALAKGDRPSGGGRVELVRAAPWAHLTVDTHGGEEHWDVEAWNLGAETLEALREAHARALGVTIETGGARVDEAEALPLVLARGSAEDRTNWLDDLFSLDADADVQGDAVRLLAMPLRNFDAAFEARVTLGEILSEAGHEAWEERALEVLLALA